MEIFPSSSIKQQLTPSKMIFSFTVAFWIQVYVYKAKRKLKEYTVISRPQDTLDYKALPPGAGTSCNFVDQIRRTGL